MGSNNSRGTFDNVAVQILPPQITFQAVEDFAEHLAAMLKAADLLVNPVHRKDLHHFPCELHEDEIQAVLLYLNGH